MNLGQDFGLLAECLDVSCYPEDFGILLLSKFLRAFTIKEQCPTSILTKINNPPANSEQ